MYTEVMTPSPADIDAVRKLIPVLFDATSGSMRCLPAADFAGVTPMQLRLLCHATGIYGIPTVELVDLIKREIGDRSAIEIGAGHGGFGQALGIPATDYMLCRVHPEVAAYYAATRQPPPHIGPNVEQRDAVGAVTKYAPQVVFGSWITQKFDEESQDGNVYGVDEEWLLSRVETYMVYGSMRTHGGKRICRRPHRVVQAPWMLGRAQEGNAALFIWDMK